MGTDDFFKKKRAQLEERKKELRTPKPNSFLIVSEGEKTEPLYFEGLANYINEKYGGNINTENPQIDARGLGRGTVSLVEATAKIVNRSKIVYEHVWVVFDKDSFEDFDEAIELANKYGYGAAWSNQSFEYWIFLHFNYADSALHRDDWVEKIDALFKARGISDEGYHKNDPNVFHYATTYGSLKAAISNASRIEASYPSRRPYSLCDPCTSVHHLILKLKPFLTELL